MLLPTTYLGPISWYQRLLHSEDVVIDQHEHYIRRTHRSRCSIQSPNGKIELSLPVKAPNHTQIKDVTIEHNEDWRRKHWGAIRSSYGQAPFFEHYAPHFEEFYSGEKINSLLEWNSKITQVVLSLLKSDRTISFTEQYVPYTSNDPRLYHTHSKYPFPLPPYTQVFADRFDFMPDLSIIDLLFCVGPEAKSYLHSS